MDKFPNSSDLRQNKTIAELNEDCEILIKREIEKCLVNYVNCKNNNSENRRGMLEISEICSELKVNSQETRQLYFSPFNRPPPPHTMAIKERCPKMLSSASATLNSQKQFGRAIERKHFMEGPKRCIDEPIQATVENYSSVPRSTVLSRTRQHLSKRNSGAQSLQIKYRTTKTQTENCAKHTVAIAVEPFDFIGLYEKATNFPTGTLAGMSRDQATQMCDHVTQSELFCIEWIHKNLFEVKLNPNTLVVDDKIRDISESPCVT
ncbi:hypothetical protein BDFB_009032 [Asbolus verrucosus]|uniref:Uncharacterized protein n=1 Tax=Asbolus verrucosus TaxID=1661398 RepID=A0A482VEX9_ASBVE|nr:hypothetical protein BDFB_009032 [Asbolus verrucosus]